MMQPLPDICGQCVKRHSTMQSHMRRHTGEARYICPSCGAKFINYNAVKRHKCGNAAGQDPGEGRKINYLLHCRYCNKDFASSAENKAHACSFRYPDDLKKVYCRICLKVITKENFNGHIAIHGEGCVCPECGIQMSTRYLKSESINFS